MEIDIRTVKEPKLKVKKDFSFAQIPLAMIGDVSLGAFMLYATIYGYCSNWRDSEPSTIVTQEDLGERMGGYKRWVISKWMNELQNKGWATVKQIGLNKPNAITLHGKKKKRLKKRINASSKNYNSREDVCKDTHQEVCKDTH